MKLKYHLRGLGIGFILTTIILMIITVIIMFQIIKKHLAR